MPNYFFPDSAINAILNTQRELLALLEIKDVEPGLPLPTSFSTTEDDRYVVSKIYEAVQYFYSNLNVLASYSSEWWSAGASKKLLTIGKEFFFKIEKCYPDLNPFNRSEYPKNAICGPKSYRAFTLLTHFFKKIIDNQFPGPQTNDKKDKNFLTSVVHSSAIFKKSLKIFYDNILLKKFRQDSGDYPYVEEGMKKPKDKKNTQNSPTTSGQAIIKDNAEEEEEDEEEEEEEEEEDEEEEDEEEEEEQKKEEEEHKKKQEVELELEQEQEHENEIEVKIELEEKIVKKEKEKDPEETQSTPDLKQEEPIVASMSGLLKVAKSCVEKKNIENYSIKINFMKAAALLKQDDSLINQFMEFIQIIEDGLYPLLLKKIIEEAQEIEEWSKEFQKTTPSLDIFQEMDNYTFSELKQFHENIIITKNSFYPTYSKFNQKFLNLINKYTELKNEETSDFVHKTSRNLYLEIMTPVILQTNIHFKIAKERVGEYIICRDNAQKALTNHNQYQSEIETLNNKFKRYLDAFHLAIEAPIPEIKYQSKTQATLTLASIEQAIIDLEKKCNQDDIKPLFNEAQTLDQMFTSKLFFDLKEQHQITQRAFSGKNNDYIAKSKEKIARMRKYIEEAKPQVLRMADEEIKRQPEIPAPAPLPAPALIDTSTLNRKKIAAIKNILLGKPSDFIDESKIIHTFLQHDRYGGLCLRLTTTVIDENDPSAQRIKVTRDAYYIFWAIIEYERNIQSPSRTQRSDGKTPEEVLLAFIEMTLRCRLTAEKDPPWYAFWKRQRRQETIKGYLAIDKVRKFSGP